MSRPEWQRDALRRIVVKGLVDTADLPELDRLCRAAHKADADSQPLPKIEHLAAIHLPPGPGSEAAVSMVSVGKIQHVNLLPSDQVLPLGPAPGLTVIYGDNASGKSGYARVIKKACRARGTSPSILPNAFESTVTSPAAAEIVCAVSGTEYPPIRWVDGVPSDPVLANVFVFDTATAQHYLEEDGPAAFTPRGLDVLPKLSRACDDIRSRIQRDIDTIDGEITATAKNWKYVPATRVGATVSALSASTKPTDIEKLAALDETQTRRLQNVNDALRADGKQKAAETRASAARLRAFAAKMRTAAEDLSDAEVRSFHTSITEAKTLAETAQVFASGQFGATYLAGTGGDLWRALWEAAQLYSSGAAYKNSEFPVITGDAKCLLCQRVLDESAAARLARFDAFCKDRSQEAAAAAAARLRRVSDKMSKMGALATEAAHVKADVAIATEEQRVDIDAFVNALDSRMNSLQSIVSKGTWVEQVALPVSQDDVIARSAETLDERAVMEESADDPTARAALQAECDELAARDWLQSVKTDVLAQIERHRQFKTLKACLKDVATGPITLKNKELTKLLVTDAFCRRFDTEVKLLGLNTLDVKMEGIEGKKGEARFGVRLLKSKNPKVRVRDIASEGEQRCIALAAFMAELSQAAHRSALVFDDPVCSLDHSYQERIAGRLAEESKTRQVIVFTHDCILLHDLQAHAEACASTVTVRRLEWSGRVPGHCREGLPWEWKSADDRLDKLGKEQRRISANWNHVPNAENVMEIREAYSWLRGTLERIVENEIFADVVFRFRAYVKVNNLDQVVGFTHQECSELKRLVSKCHNVTEAHDSPPGRHPVIPTPTDLARDLDATRTLLETIRNRRKTNRSTSGVRPSTPAP
jgi:ABC-type cobalamin/Fe3+-siderophores transport system ATPase subunit